MAESDRREKILIIGNGFDLAHVSTWFANSI